MHFVKKHNKEDLKKMQANSAKAMSTCAEAIQGPCKAQRYIPKGNSHKLNPLAYIAHFKLGECACAHITKGLRLYWPKSKAKVQTKPQAAAAAQAHATDHIQVLAGAQDPTQAPQERPLPVDVRMEGLL
ncbi:ribosomal protein L29 [Phyllostomus discolor]|uniref:Ribosomal protein L29 n=1 Tax=Phyllostomus discolor TaxID=89673 RepID=A0A834B4P8_9CHIR|nr:ribosomal protein L29 [Phyllostomus discolor]